VPLRESASNKNFSMGQCAADESAGGRVGPLAWARGAIGTGREKFAQMKGLSVELGFIDL